MRTARVFRTLSRDRQSTLQARQTNHYRKGRPLVAAKQTHGVPLSKRARQSLRNARLPFIPPEDWHEPSEDGRQYKFVVQPAGEGYRHVLTVAEVRQRLAQLPAEFTRDLEVVQFSRMTRKKQSFPCYGMQWGATLYLYPIEENLVEQYPAAPKPSQTIEADLYGGQWIQDAPDAWRLVWTEEAIKDFYLNNILIHELGHLVDVRNHSYRDRERYAEWFASHYGYPASAAARRRHPNQTRRRHHAKVR